MTPKHAKAMSDEEPGSSKKHVKKPKDPNAPKKPRSAYILWITENRAKIAEEGMKPAEVMKKAGEMWNTVDAKTKKKYETLAQKDHERYDREMADYDPPPEFRKKDNDKPKKPRSAYVLWCGDNRAALTEEGMKPTEVMKKLGEAWKKVDEKTKKKYEDLAQGDKERYAGEMKEHEEESTAALEKPATSKPTGKKAAASIAQQDHTKEVPKKAAAKTKKKA